MARRVNMHLDEEFAARIEEKKPKSLALAAFCALLIEQQLDGVDTLTERALASVVSKSSSSSSSKEETSKRNKNKAVKSRKSTEATPEFELFWRSYQRSPLKANCQSKAKAWEVWQELIKGDVSPADLIRAADMAVAECVGRQRANEFCAPLPDCFRWLRDERYAVLLEGHTPTQSQGDWL